MLPIILLIVIAAAIISTIAFLPSLKRRRRARVAKQPFSKEWRKILQRRMPYFKSMPSDLQLQLKAHIQVFLSEKTFYGRQGIEINDEIRVTIAAQACLLLLNRKTDYYPKLKSILVYPRAFVKEHQNSLGDGMHFTQHSVLAGESWSFGKIVLSWQDTLSGANIPDDGHNVVIHEFAHQLDQENGSANGAPILGKDQNYQTWSTVFSEQFAQLQHQAQLGEASIFDYYGATNPAEFFAVASEVFFERAEDFKHQHPNLYQQLSLFYKLDPTTWH